MNKGLIFHLLNLKEIDENKEVHLDLWLITKVEIVNPLEIHEGRNKSHLGQLEFQDFLMLTIHSSFFVEV